jgi:hypothetical protein
MPKRKEPTRRRRGRKVAGTADYIIPLAVVGLGVFVVYKVWNAFGGGSGSGLAADLQKAAQAAAGSGVSIPPAVQAQLNSNISAQTWLNSYQTTRGQDCFTNALYLANPQNALLGAGDAQSLYNLIHSQAGTWFSDGDFTGILAAFQNVVGNQTDVSEVANLFQTNDGMDLFAYIVQGSTFGNGTNPAGNNMQLVAQFVQWAIALPQTGTEA